MLKKFPYLVWAIATLILLVAAQLAIILLPSLLTLIVGLVLLITGLLLFFTRLIQDGFRQRRIPGNIVAGILFLALFSFILNMTQQHLLFGYKAVDNKLGPELITGDHYFVDKLLFTFNELEKGDIYIVRNQQRKKRAARLVETPGNETSSKKEYIFDLGGKTIAIPKSQVLAHAVLIYGTYDPVAESIIWERVGRRIP